MIWLYKSLGEFFKNVLYIHNIVFITTVFLTHIFCSTSYYFTVTLKFVVLLHLCRPVCELFSNPSKTLKINRILNNLQNSNDKTQECDALEQLGTWASFNSDGTFLLVFCLCVWTSIQLHSYTYNTYHRSMVTLLYYITGLGNEPAWS